MPCGRLPVGAAAGAIVQLPREEFACAMVQERPSRVKRRLSAILAADVAGYSRLMHNDEEATHARLTMLLTEAVEPSIAQHGGRIVKNTGDGLLAEFRSAVEAVRAAMQFQERVHDLTIGDTEDKRLAFRVGINIGDVIVEAHDIFGDGVNIAARLEGIAEPGGICISASAYDQVLGKVAIGGSRDWRVRAGPGAGSQFGRSACYYRLGEALHWSWRGNRGSLPGGVSAFSPG
jgi:class 3 adenylate cyclase